MAKQAKLYKKQLLKFGKLHHDKAPNGVLNITKEYVQELMDNFQHSPFVAVTRGHLKEGEAEKNPELIITKNIKGLEMDEHGLNAKLTLDSKELDKYNDVSLEIDPDAEDHTTKEKVGNAIRKIAMVTDPYVKGLKPFTALKESKNSILINLSEIMTEEKKAEVEEKSLEEVKAESKEKETTEATTDTEETTEEETEEKGKTKTEAENPKESEEAKEDVKLSEADDLQKRIVELEEQVAEQSTTLAKKEAESKYRALLEAGKIIPAQQEAFIALCATSKSLIKLSDGKESTIGILIDNLFEKAPKVIEFGEKGVDTESTGDNEKLKVELRERRSELSDKEFEKLWDKHGKTAKAYASA